MIKNKCMLKIFLLKILHLISILKMKINKINNNT